MRLYFALVALALVAVAAFVATFDPNRYKDEAAQAVKDATGRELVIAGDLYDPSVVPALVHVSSFLAAWFTPSAMCG